MEDLKKPSVPLSFPIKTLEDLASRSYFDTFHYPFNVSSVPLPPHAAEIAPRPRILVCHDMMGGYTDDRWVQGGDNPDAYAIWHWHLMDVFVYFSHNLVTLPPVCWTNAAHTHGVKVLGTFIMEWSEGKVMADKLLETVESARMYAEKLAELASALNFDGWLINMEVQLKKSQIPNLKEFVAHLSQTMHTFVPGSLVIWYDSVTKDGSLLWQNVLNEENKPFFDLCDGIFINYNWKANYPNLSGAAAGDRRFDVYMGIDVFGRGSFGGGQWNTNVALDVLRDSKISAAIFAPGWVYESKQPPDFQTAQNLWWSLIEKSWGILQYYPKVLPFYSNFDQGHGYHFSIDGLPVANRPWNNISSQQFQPVLNYSTTSGETPVQVAVNFKEESYSGGGNITFNGSLKNNEIFTTRLFHGKLALGDVPVHITFSVRSEENSLLGISLHFSDTSGSATSTLIAEDYHATNNFDETVTPSQVIPSKGNKIGWIVHETDIQKNGYLLTEIHAVCYIKASHENKQLALQSRKMLGKKATDGDSSSFFSSLGHITLQISGRRTEFPPADSWSITCQDIEWASSADGAKVLNLKILWNLKEEHTESFSNYNIYFERLVYNSATDPASIVGDGERFIGVARVQAYYVSKLEVPSSTTALRFIVQPCGLDGTCQSVHDSPAFQLVVAE